jgi:hypothetical protein
LLWCVEQLTLPLRRRKIERVVRAVLLLKLMVLYDTSVVGSHG